MYDKFLHDGQVWIGFDGNGKSVAASVGYRKPSTTSSKSLMKDCAIVLKCKYTHGDKVLGNCVSDFEVIKKGNKNG
jgi:hypothetical protein